VSARAADGIILNLREVVTLAGPPGPRRGADLGRVESIPGGAIAVRDGRITAVGREAEVRSAHAGPATEIIDGEGALALPGFVDPHTHLIFAGERADEFEERLRGVSYGEIAARGGGIRSTVRKVRAASAEDLARAALPRLDRMLAHGTTCAEAKTGYGLSLADEEKSLAAIEGLGRLHPLTLVPTFLGAHEVPDEFRADRAGYVRLLVEEMIPRFAARARFCDVFCEEGVFTVAESRAILEAGKRRGLRPKIHADELAGTGGAELAAEVGALTADHLVACSEEGIRRMAAAGVIPVLLPGTSFFLRLARRAPARRMVEAGLAVALATDCNPGSSPTESMAIVLTLASIELGLTPAEALIAATVNAAYAVGEGGRRGSLEPGKAADIVLYDAESWRSIAYHYGVSLVAKVLIGGRLAWERGRRPT
jgi:imidazolonepropionase